MSNTVIQVENISKQYRLGEVGTGSIAHDLNRWWHKIRGKEDPYLLVGETNDRTKAGNSAYVWALRSVNFSINQGDVIGIIGRNGAGKSTLLKILSRTTMPSTGSIKIKGRVASLLEVGTGFHPELTGRDNVYLNGSILGMSKREIDKKFDEIVDFAGVERYIDTPVKRYSSGMYVRLAFGVAAHLEPEILIVDEVLAVGDAEFQKKALGKMHDVSNKEGRTVLFVSHSMATIQNLCTRALLMEQGTVVMDASTDAVINHYIKTSSKNKDIGLSERTDRSGNGAVKFLSFHIENKQGDVIESIIPGSDVIFVFTLENLVGSNPSIDLGIAISTSSDHREVILYSSYQNTFFTLSERVNTVKLTVKEFPLSKGYYKVVGRILQNGTETDSLQNGIGEINVIDGDFYQSGNFGSMGLGSLLLKGDWELLNNIK